MADLAPTIQPAVTDPQTPRAPQLDRNGTAGSLVSFLGLLAAALTSAQDGAAQPSASTLPAPAAEATPAAAGSAPAEPKLVAPTLPPPPVDASSTKATASARTELPPSRGADARADRFAEPPAQTSAPTPAPPLPLSSIAAAATVPNPGDPATAASPAATPVVAENPAEIVAQDAKAGSPIPGPAATTSKAAAKPGSTQPARPSQDAAASEDPAGAIPVVVDQAIPQLPLAAAPPIQPPPKPTIAGSEPAATIGASAPQVGITASAKGPAESRAEISAAPARTESGPSAAAKPGAISMAVEPAQQSPDSLAATTPSNTPSHAAQPLAAPIAARSSAETPAPAPSPAAQVAQAIAEPVKISLASPAQQPGETQVMTIHLTPSDLGRVVIRIERPADGPARIEMAVERPETLQRLVHDQPQLQHALDQAGIPQAGRTIQFSLSTDNAPAAAGTTLSGDAGSSGGQRSQQGYSGPHARAPEQIETAPTFATWARSGLDITA